MTSAKSILFAPAIQSLCFKQNISHTRSIVRLVNWKAGSANRSSWKKSIFHFFRTFDDSIFYDFALCSLSRLIISLDSLEILCKTPIKAHTKSDVGGVINKASINVKTMRNDFKFITCYRRVAFYLDFQSRRKSSHEMKDETRRVFKSTKSFIFKWIWTNSRTINWRIKIFSFVALIKISRVTRDQLSQFPISAYNCILIDPRGTSAMHSSHSCLRDKRKNNYEQ